MKAGVSGVYLRCGKATLKLDMRELLFLPKILWGEKWGIFGCKYTL